MIRLSCHGAGRFCAGVDVRQSISHERRNVWSSRIDTSTHIHVNFSEPYGNVSQLSLQFFFFAKATKRDREWENKSSKSHQFKVETLKSLPTNGSQFSAARNYFLYACKRLLPLIDHPNSQLTDTYACANKNETFLSSRQCWTSES